MGRIPTWEEYQEATPGATWAQYVARYSAMAAEIQVAAGEIPEEYGRGYSFTPAGVWVASGSPAAVGGLPAEIRDLFPGVEQTYTAAYEQATQGSVITSSPVAEPQTSFLVDPGWDEYDQRQATKGVTGGSGPVAYAAIGEQPQQGVGNVIGGIDQSQFQNGNGGNGAVAPNGASDDGGMGWLLLLGLLALGLG